jgi:hypothetical protein
VRNIRPGFSLKKVVCDAMMFLACMRMVRRSRYDLIHAVEESAFIAAAAQAVHGVPYVYDMDSSLAEQMVEAYPRLQFALPFMRYCESVAVRRSTGVLTVCAALEDLALGHDPAKPVGRVEDSTLLPPAASAEFLGPRPLNLLPGLLSQAEVLVSPRVKGTNTPMKIYSYLDSGTPVLATRLRTHTQVLDDRFAYLVDPTPQALGEGLAALLADRPLRERLALRAKEYVQQEFTPEAARRKLTSFYSVMESKVAGAGV